MTTPGSSPLLAMLDPAGEATMRSLIGGAVRTQAVYVAAKLGLADQLSLGPRAAEELAQRTGADPATLRRLLRFLVFHGVFAETDDGRFALNRAAESLQSGHPRSLRPGAIRAGEGMWEVSSRLLDAVRTGRTPHDDVHGVTFFERMAERGKETEFAVRMGSSIAGLGQAVAALDCVRDAGTVVDVGGGHGALLIALLQAHPRLRGVLFDRPQMLEAARAAIEGASVADRCELAAGDFFEAVPRGDVHLLSWVLHDWDDGRAARILRSCREAGGDGAALVLVEVLLPRRAQAAEETTSGVVADPYTLDLQMLLLTGGRERTEEEYGALLRQGGYEIGGTAGPVSSRGASVITAKAIANEGK
jgi:hypothetical protein